MDWFQAAEQGDTNSIIAMLNQGAIIDARDSHGDTAMMHAVRGRRIETLETLLQGGADIHIENRAGWTAMTWAAVQARGLVLRPHPYAIRNPDSRPLSLLTGAGAHLRLREAIVLNDVALARCIYEQDRSIDVSESASFTFDDPYLVLAAGIGSIEMIDFLLDRGANIEGSNDVGHTALMRAAQVGNAEIVNRLLERGADVNAGWPCETALSLSEAQHHQEIASLLLSLGANRRLVDAVDRCDIHLARDLLLKGARPELEHVIIIPNESVPDVIAPRVDRLIVHAVKQGNTDMVRLLLDHGATIQNPYVDYRTPLAEASARGNTSMVRLLLARGADVNAVGSEGITATNLASRSGHEEIVELLRRSRA